MSAVYGMSMHFVPSNDLICLLQGGVDDSSWRSLQESDLLGNEAGHEYEAELGGIVHIESIFADDRGDESVFAALIDAEGDIACVVTKGAVRFEQD